MSERTTKAQIASMFGHLCKDLGKRVATTFNDVGGWGLDYSSVYGGYVIYEVSNKGGAQSHPFGSTRHTGNEFWTMMRFASDAVRIAKGK